MLIKEKRDLCNNLKQSIKLKSAQIKKANTELHKPRRQDESFDKDKSPKSFLTQTSCNQDLKNARLNLS